MTQTRGLSISARAVLMGQLRGAAATLTAPALATARDFATLPPSRDLAQGRALAESLGLESPFFQSHEGVAGARTRMEGRDYVNFASYNYLGLNGDPRVNLAAIEAVARHGTSASASRFASGERPVHARLEAALAACHGTEDAVAMVSGHATNVTVLGHLLGPQDLIVHDALVHNSCVEGMRLSGARRLVFPHNDVAAATALLAAERHRHPRALVLIEGHYSMDGTVPELARFRDAAHRHDAWLMVDEAHSLGCLGATGRGIAEAQGLTGADADIWMGTLSKSLAACGGYIAGSRVLVDMLRHTAPGFVYSVGLAPPLAAAAEAALGVMLEEPWRVRQLQANARHFRDSARAAGFDCGPGVGAAIVPVILGDSVTALQVARRMARQGINVQPIAFPAVPEGQARLRFFLSAQHTTADLNHAVEALGGAVRAVA